MAFEYVELPDGWLAEMLEGPRTPKRFYLVAERREDGGLRITSPEVPGLVLSGEDPAEVMADVLPAIDALLRHNQ